VSAHETSFKSNAAKQRENENARERWSFTYDGFDQVHSAVNHNVGKYSVFNNFESHQTAFDVMDLE